MEELIDLLVREAGALGYTATERNRDCGGTYHIQLRWRDDFIVNWWPLSGRATVFIDGRGNRENVTQYDVRKAESLIRVAEDYRLKGQENGNRYENAAEGVCQGDGTQAGSGDTAQRL